MGMVNACCTRDSKDEINPINKKDKKERQFLIKAQSPQKSIRSSELVRDSHFYPLTPEPERSRNVQLKKIDNTSLTPGLVKKNALTVDAKVKSDFISRSHKYMV